MLYYKLTCIKDLPEVEEGFSYIFDEWLSSPFIRRNRELERKVNGLLAYQDNERFVKKEIAYEKANQYFRCPCCNDFTLFTKISDEYSKVDGDVKYYYVDTSLFCPRCGNDYVVSKTITRSKII